TTRIRAFSYEIQANQAYWILLFDHRVSLSSHIRGQILPIIPVRLIKEVPRPDLRAVFMHRHPLLPVVRVATVSRKASTCLLKVKNVDHSPEPGSSNCVEKLWYSYLVV